MSDAVLSEGLKTTGIQQGYPVINFDSTSLKMCYVIYVLL